MKDRRTHPIVFFNASVIIAGLGSPSGGSAKILSWAKQGKIRGVISEIVADEVCRKSQKVNVYPETVKKEIGALRLRVLDAPDEQSVKKFGKVVLDAGDAHVLASSSQAGADVLVTLDRKHLLVLDGKIKAFRILSPKQLIERLSR